MRFMSLHFLTDYLYHNNPPRIISDIVKIIVVMPLIDHIYHSIFCYRYDFKFGLVVVVVVCLFLNCSDTCKCQV